MRNSKKLCFLNHEFYVSTGVRQHFHEERKTLAEPGQKETYRYMPYIAFRHRTGGKCMESTKDFGVGKLPEDDSKLTNEQTYDAALAAMVTKLKKYVIPLVNEVFGEQYIESTNVEIRNNKHIIRKTDGSLKRRETDAYVELAGATRLDGVAGSSRMAGQQVTKYYHFECETWYDRSIVLRIAEYESVIAVENMEEMKDGVILNYPDSAVIFLRPGDKIPKAMKIIHRASDGAEMSYDVPAIRIADYGLDEIFEKNTLFKYIF